MNLADFREFPERLAMTARILSALFRAQIPASLEAALGDGGFLDDWPLTDSFSLSGVAVLRGGVSRVHEGIVPDLRENTPMAPHEVQENPAGENELRGNEPDAAETGELSWRDDAMHLFGTLGRPLAEPHESVWLSREHLLFEEQTLQVRACYRRYGLGLVDQGREPDDHIGFELLFLAELLGLLAGAWEEMAPHERTEPTQPPHPSGLLDSTKSPEVQGEETTGGVTPETLAAWRAAQVRLEWVGDPEAVVDSGTVLADLRGFYREHFVRFAPLVCEKLDAHARSRIYRALPDLTRGFMASLEEFLEVAPD